jgi:hypothetical protein
VNDKLYVVTRRDLSPGYQLVQSCHAIREFDRLHHGYQGVANLACLSATDENELKRLIVYLESNQIKYAIFREPDVDDQITAIAFEPGDKSYRLVSSLPLALKENKS